LTLPYNLFARKAEITELHSSIDFGTINYLKAFGNYYAINYTKGGITTFGLYTNKDNLVVSIKDGDSRFRGKLAAQFVVYNLDMSWDQKFVTLNTWCDPVIGPGPNGGPLDQVCDILKVDIENKSVTKIIGKGDKLSTENFQFNQLTREGTIYQISSAFPGKNGDIFTASVLNPIVNKIQMKGIFRIKDNKIIQLTGDLFVGADVTHPVDAPKEDLNGNIFFLGFVPNKLTTNIKVMSSTGQNVRTIFTTEDRTPMERLSVPVSLYTDIVNRTIYVRNPLTNSAIYVSPLIAETIIYSNRFYNMFSGSLWINGDAFFTKKPTSNAYNQNTSISNIVRSPSTYAEVVNSADSLSGSPIGNIGDDIGAQKCAVMGIAKNTKDKIFRASFIRVDEGQVNGRELTLTGCFAGSNKNNTKVIINGTIVHPNDIISISEDKITIRLAVNVSGENTFSITRDDLESINSIKLNIPTLKPNFRFVNQIKNEIGVKENVEIKWCADIEGRAEVSIDPDNPITIGADFDQSCGESVHSIEKSSTFRVKFTAINKVVEIIEFDVKIKTPEIIEIRSDDDTTKLTPGGIGVIYGNNFSKKELFSTEEKTKILNGIEVKINDINVEILYVSENKVIFIVPEDTPTGNSSVWLYRNGDSTSEYIIDVMVKENIE
jgi:hypothetical protein